jgi:hypothetical protein
MLIIFNVIEGEIQIKAFKVEGDTFLTITYLNKELVVDVKDTKKLIY